MHNKDTPNVQSVLKENGGKYAISLTYREPLANPEDIDKNYELLGLDDIFLDFAGGFPPAHPIHNGLAALQAGQCVPLDSENSKTGVQDKNGLYLAKLSNSGSGNWARTGWGMFLKLE